MKDIETAVADFRVWFAAEFTAGRVPGARCLLMKQDTVLCDETLGSVAEQEQAIHAHSLFRLASASKLFVSCIFLAMRDAGEVRLDQAVAEVLPAFADLKVLDAAGGSRPAERTMVMQDLLQHTCGYGYGDTEPYGSALRASGLLSIDQFDTNSWVHDLSLQQWAETLAGVPLEDEPGTRVSYGLGHDILGAVIESVSGLSLQAALEKYLVRPAGLKDTFFVVPQARIDDLVSFYHAQDGELTCIEKAHESPFRHQPMAFSGGGGWDMFGNGGLVSSSYDTSRLLRMIVNGGTIDGHSLLTAESAACLQASQTSPNVGDMQPGCGYSFGVACVDNADEYQGKAAAGTLWWGGSTNTLLFYHPETQLYGVFLMQLFPFAHRAAIFRFESLAGEM